MYFYTFFIICCLNLIFLAMPSSGTTCDENRIMEKIYRDIKCTPILDAKKQCPSAYDCPIFRTIKANPDKCYWNNTQYEAGYKLPDELTVADCFANCYCSVSKDFDRTKHDRQAEFRCANIECPSDMGSRPEPGCHYEYSIRNCCPTGQICPNKDRNVRQSCMVDNKTIMHGMRFEPSNSECSSCVCNDGKVECKAVSCGIELLHLNDLANGVGVVFYGQGRCCPIGYVWPNGNDVIRSGSLIKQQNNNPTLECKFGNLTVNIGDEIITNETNENTKCTCLVPPLITCIQQPQSESDN